MNRTSFSLVVKCQLIAAFCLFGCVVNAKPMVINIGNGAEPKTVDPHQITGVPENHIAANLFEGLTSLDPKTMKPIPAGAESWDVSKDGRVYTFKLRKNAKWSNGEPLTAKDYIYGWLRILNPKTASEYAYYGYYFKNGKKFYDGEVKDAAQVGFKAINDYTIQVTLENPTPFFLALLNHVELNPVHKATLEKFGDRWVRPENIVSNGPFMLEKWEINKVLTMKKNPNYWDAVRVKLDGASFFPTENLATEENMFRTGQLHSTYEVPYEKLPSWQKDKSGVFKSDTLLGTYYYDVNPNKPPLTDKRVRRALNYAIDRERLVNFVAKGLQPPAIGFTPPKTGPDAYNPPMPLPKDGARIEEAKKLLADAGFPGGKGFPPIEFVYNTNEGHKKIAEAVQQMWKDNLGIEVKLLNQEWKVFLNTRKQHDFQIARDAWIGDYNDANSMLDIWQTGLATNKPNWSNAQYDKLIKQASSELNAKKRMKLFYQAEAILLEELPVIPIYWYRHNFLLSRDVQGWSHNNLELIMLKYVSLKK